MPVTLIHGPAGPEKAARLKETLSRLMRDADGAFCVITENRAQASRLKAELASLSPDGLISGARVTTFDDLFLKLVKRNYHRAHLADDALRLYALLVAVASRTPRQLADTAGLARHLERLLTFFDALRTCGMGSDAAAKLFSGQVLNDAVFPVMSRFCELLAARHYFDKPGLFAAVLDGLRSGGFVWTEAGVRDVVVTGVYPLHAGHREFFRLMARHVPEVRFHVFYDDDYTRDDDVLAFGYEDLGGLADQTEYVAAIAAPLAVAVYSDPAAEAVAVAEDIAKRLRAGVPAHALAVAIPAAYAAVFAVALRQREIPFSLHLSQKARDYASDGGGDLDCLAAVTRQGEGAAFRRLQAIQALRSHEENVGFIKTLFAAANAPLPRGAEEAALRHLANACSFVPARIAAGIAVAGFEGALPFSDRGLFVAGLAAEHVSSSQDEPVYATSLYARREFAELLNFPNYRHRVRIEKIRQLICAAQPLSLSRALKDASGRDQTPLLRDDAGVIEVRVSQAAVASQGIHREFPSPSASKYSVTALEDYLTCPYQYYARRVLKLKRPDGDGIEPPADVRGHFVHDLMQRLGERRHAAYLAALKEPALLPGFLEAIPAEAQELARDFKEFAGLSEASVRGFVTRAVRAAVNFTRDEAVLFQDGKKTTLPDRFEWVLAGKDGGPFVMQTRLGAIHLSGRADRVDVDASGSYYSVVDFKTGEPPSGPDIGSAKALQLPLYLIAAGEALYPGALPSAGLYGGLKKIKIGGFAIKGTPDAKATASRCKLSAEDWDALKERLADVVADAVTGIRAAQFDPAPRDGVQTCRACSFKHVCGWSAEEESEDESDS